MNRPIFASWRSLALGTTVCLGIGALSTSCDSGPSAAEALQTNADKKFEETYKPPPKRPPPEDMLAPPTDAEFKAWNRHDPAGEKHLYKWDKKNADKMQNYAKQLMCYREKMMEEGQKAMTAEPMTPEFEAWEQFKAAFIPFVNRWQQRLQANEPRIKEKSKTMGFIFEAHELIINGYPKAYNAKDEHQLKKVEAQWLLANDKINKYWERVGAPFPGVKLETEKDKAAWEKFCAEALVEPKKGPKKVRGKKGKI